MYTYPFVRIPVPISLCALFLLLARVTFLQGAEQAMGENFEKQPSGSSLPVYGEEACSEGGESPKSEGTFLSPLSPPYILVPPSPALAEVQTLSEKGRQYFFALRDDGRLVRAVHYLLNANTESSVSDKHVIRAHYVILTELLHDGCTTLTVDYEAEKYEQIFSDAIRALSALERKYSSQEAKSACHILSAMFHAFNDQKHVLTFRRSLERKQKKLLARPHTLGPRAATATRSSLVSRFRMANTVNHSPGERARGQRASHPALLEPLR